MTVNFSASGLINGKNFPQRNVKVLGKIWIGGIDCLHRSERESVVDS